MIETDPPYNVTETQRGTKESVPCAGRGTCDTSSGLCQCVEGFSGSDGDGGVGDRRDCGYINPGGFTLNEA